MFRLPPSSRKNRISIDYFYFLCVLYVLGMVILSQTHFLHKEKYGLTGDMSSVISNKTISYSFPKVNEEEITAKAYVVYDVVDTKPLLGKNENIAFSLASMTKLMTAVTALELASTTPTHTVTITKDVLDEGYDPGLRDKQSFSLSEIIKYMLVYSSNDAANAVALSFGEKQVFVKKMNEIAQREGFSSLVFTNPSGLDTKDVYGGYGTPTDVARLMVYASKKMPSLLDATTKTRARVLSSTGPISGIQNTNQIVEMFTGISGSKTGFTDEAGGNLTIIFDIALGRPVVIVVMGSTKEDRFFDVEKLYNQTKKALQ